MPIAQIADRELAELAFQKINATIAKVNELEAAATALPDVNGLVTRVTALETTMPDVNGLVTRVTALETTISQSVIKRTISTVAPTSIPADGEEWVVV